MKKFLSLVLALVMTMSLVTISAGAKDFTDNDQVTYTEAVQVMDLLGVINGYSDGSFKPTNTLTRGAAAKIICNLLLTPSVADTLPVNNTGFKDVPTTNTFAKYVAYCANQGIINGYSDGTFKPAGTLTGYAFLKMLLGALGYDPQIEGFTGETFALNVATKIGELKLAKGNDAFVGTKAVTREEACLYAFNMLSTDMVKYASKGSKITVNGVEIIQGATPAESTGKTFAAVKFSGLKEGVKEDGFGRTYRTWTYKGTTVSVLDSEADLVYTGSVSAKKIYNDLKLKANTNYDFYVNGTQVTYVTKGDVFYNWEAETVPGNNKWEPKTFGGLSYMVEVYYTAATKDKDGNTVNAKVEIIEVEYKLGTVGTPVKATDLVARYITIKELGNTYHYTTNAFAKGDKVLYTYVPGTGDNKGIQTVQLAQSIEGTVTYTKGSKVTINGASYTAKASLELTVGSTGTYYLGIDNSIIGFSGTKSVSVDSVAYVYSIQPVTGTVSDDGLSISGGKKAYFVKADGTKDSAMIAYTLEKDANGNEKEDVEANRIYSITSTGVTPYTINSNGEIVKAQYNEAINSIASGEGGVTIGKNNAKVLNKYMTSDTKFVFVDTTKNKLTVSTATGYKNVDTKTGANVTLIFDKETNNVLLAFVGGKVAASETNYAILADAVPGIGGTASNKTYTYAVVGAGTTTELVADKDTVFSGIAVGDRFSYVIEDGKVKNVEKVANTTKVTGTIKAMNDDYIVVDNGDALTVSADCEYFLKDADTNTVAAGAAAKVDDQVIVYTNGKTGSDLKVVAIVITKEA